MSTEASGIPVDKLGIPKEFVRYTDPAGPRDFRLMAAKGLVPAPPKILLAIQYCLLADPDPEVADASRQGMLAYPVKLLGGAIDDQTHPKVLEFFAFERLHDDALMEHIILRRQTNDRTICYLAEHVSDKLVEIVASNQQRLLITPGILSYLKRNPNVTKAQLERVESFLRMYHAIEPEEPSAQAALQTGAPQEEPLETSLQFEHGYEEDEDDWPEEFIDECARDSGEEGSGDLWLKLSKMSIAKKIKLAYFGNSTVRSILIRDTNKMVATAVMKSPRLTDSEVVAIAKNRNVCDEVLRELARNKEWFKSYAVKLALVNNPKTPAAVAVPIVSQLMVHDLKRLAGNRNVSSVISTTARQAVRKKSPDQ